jgi:hypothetical protein
MAASTRASRWVEINSAIFAEKDVERAFRRFDRRAGLHALFEAS